VATPLSVVPYVEPFLPAFAEGSDLYAQASGTPHEPVDLIAAVSLRESWAGHAPGYRPKGSPDGRGDWTVRVGGWTRRSGVKVYPDTDEARQFLRAVGWSIPKRKGATIPGPYAVPVDGEGWGHGLLQCDALGDFADLVAPAPWPVERQAAAACAMLGLARRQLADAGFAGHALFERAVVARYNASLERVRTGLEAGAVDVGTTGGDYSADVEHLRAAVRARWPDRFPPRVA
jgi:hypothetical protein